MTISVKYWQKHQVAAFVGSKCGYQWLGPQKNLYTEKANNNTSANADVPFKYNFRIVVAVAVVVLVVVCNVLLIVKHI